jgi:hypothetical protein
MADWMVTAAANSANGDRLAYGLQDGTVTWVDAAGGILSTTQE